MAEEIVMDEPTPPPSARVRPVALALGVVCGVLDVTTYSIKGGPCADAAFAAMTLGALAWVALDAWSRERRAFEASTVTGPSWWAAAFAAALLLLGSVPSALLSIGQCELQREPAPGGLWEATVRFTPVGAWAGGNGSTTVCVSTPWLPVEKVVFARRCSYADVIASGALWPNQFRDDGVWAAPGKVVWWDSPMTMWIAERDERLTVDPSPAPGAIAGRLLGLR